MNNIDKIYSNSQNLQSFSKAYLSYMGELFNALNSSDMEEFINELEIARKAEKTIFIIGNGGSAATASHMSMDLDQIFFKLPSFVPAFKTISLANNTPLITAISNDFGYEHIFTKQLEIQYEKGDILIAISASGNSPNVVNATTFVKSRGGKVLGLLGFDGGKLKGLCNTSIVVNTSRGEYGPVEDIHLILNHLFFAWFYNKYKGDRGTK